MNPKRLLLVQNDPMLATCFGEALAAIGVDVHVAQNGQSALQRFHELDPDLILLDLIVPMMDGPRLINAFRKEKKTPALPIVCLPTSIEPLALAAAEKATKVLERYADPIAAVVNAVETALGGQASLLRSRSESAENEARLARLHAELPARLIDLRQQLQALATGQGGPSGIPDFFQAIHNFAEQTVLLNLKAVVTLAGAIEALTFDIQELPELLNPSTLRTLGQGIDLLGKLLEEDRWMQVKHPSDARILVVEDDLNAQQLITASIKLVQLDALALASPTAGLGSLQAGAFDLVFLDIGLPEMNGFDLCTKVRALPQFEKTPIVFLTGMATFQNRAQSTLSGGNDFIAKPFNVRELGIKALIWVFKGQLRLV